MCVSKPDSCLNSLVGEKIGVSRTVYAKYETAMATPPLETLYKICKAFEISSDELLGFTGDDDNNVRIIQRMR